ncbi:Hypothetical predicted protein [Olea europaea subsp. europaea]|uniref:Uncharacterized protein n=1 Tax=Olea europaea subsp. europaea TaxID=158383 RepID=A0A8S0TLV9_OLEEU|nr:Hypothetical predicted protein [Olea europaea subsp. europaea]
MPFRQRADSGRRAHFPIGAPLAGALFPVRVQHARYTLVVGAAHPHRLPVMAHSPGLGVPRRRRRRHRRWPTGARSCVPPVVAGAAEAKKEAEQRDPVMSRRGPDSNLKQSRRGAAAGLPEPAREPAGRFFVAVELASWLARHKAHTHELVAHSASAAAAGACSDGRHTRKRARHALEPCPAAQRAPRAGSSRSFRCPGSKNSRRLELRPPHSNRQTDSLYSPRVLPVRLQAAAVASVPRRARKSIGREEFISAAAAAAAASQWPVATHANAGRRVARSRALKCDTRRGGRPANLVQHRPAVLRFAGMRPSPHTPSRQGRRIRTQWHTMAPAGAIL